MMFTNSAEFHIHKAAVTVYEDKIGQERLKLQLKIYDIARSALIFALGVATVASFVTRTFAPLGYTCLASFVVTLITRAVSGLFGFKIQFLEAYTLLKPLTHYSADSEEYKSALIQWERLCEDDQREQQRNQGNFGNSIGLYIRLLTREHVKYFVGHQLT